MAQRTRQIGLGRQRTMHVHHALERSCEALVPLRPILLFQKLVGIRQGLHLGQPQVLYQPVLIGAEASFHSPLGLRRVRRDPADSQFSEPAAELRQAVRLLPLLGAFLGPWRHREGRCTDPPCAHCSPRTATARPCSPASRRAARNVPHCDWWHRRSTSPGSARCLGPPASRGSRCPTAPTPRSRCVAAARNASRRVCAAALSIALPPPSIRASFPC